MLQVPMQVVSRLPRAAIGVNRPGILHSCIVPPHSRKFLSSKINTEKFNVFSLRLEPQGNRIRPCSSEKESKVLTVSARVRHAKGKVGEEKKEHEQLTKGANGRQGQAHESGIEDKRWEIDRGWANRRIPGVAGRKGAMTTFSLQDLSLPAFRLRASTSSPLVLSSAP